MRDISREQLLAELRALRPQFEREGVVHMAIFGSRARGDNRPDSDVDLLLETAGGRKFSMLDAIGVAHIVKDEIGLEASVVTRPGLDENPSFKERVHRDEVGVF